MTEAGEMCPMHGLKECGAYEDAAMTTATPPLEESDLVRIKTLAGFMIK
jgi:hypothetical protein